MIFKCAYFGMFIKFGSCIKGGPLGSFFEILKKVPYPTNHMFFGFDSLTGYYFASGTLKVFMDFGPFVPKGPQGPF